MGRNNVRGFTLIELVVVITILGILAAFAVPRFIALQAQARVASVQGLVGSLRSAAMLTHSSWLISRDPQVQMEGALIDMADGYPVMEDIALTLIDHAGFDFEPSTGTFEKVGAADPTRCSVTYVPPLGPGLPPQIQFEVDCA